MLSEPDLREHDHAETAVAPRKSPALPSRAGGFVYRDPAMKAVAERAARAASSDASVLITGRSGTGKEVMARFIHDNSTRARGPFVAVNCAAIPDQLLEAELFGYERGAFSGAVAQRIGKLEAAQKGTLLLDEVSEIPPHLQAKLLRVLQEREVERVGGNTAIRLDVRIIATSNRDLEREVRQQRFRDDLYFRLNVIGIAIPCLRDRPLDIDVLVDHFAAKYCDARGRSAPWFSDAARAALRSHDWPGNVRELENAIHRAVVLADGSTIAPGDLEISTPAAFHATPVAGIAALTGRPLHLIEREAILNTLRMTEGNRTKTASLLGLSIRTLRNKIGVYSAQGFEVPINASARSP